jgi:phage gp46-like protein
MGPVNPVSLEQWASIEELAAMSIGTDKGTWWADPAFGSDLWLLKQEGKVDERTAGTLERMVRECLRWLVDEGLADDIDCAAELNGKNRIDYQVTVRRPHGSPVVVREVWSVV